MLMMVQAATPQFGSHLPHNPFLNFPTFHGFTPSQWASCSTPSHRPTPSNRRDPPKRFTFVELDLSFGFVKTVVSRLAHFIGLKLTMAMSFDFETKDYYIEPTYDFNKYGDIIMEIINQVKSDLF